MSLFPKQAAGTNAKAAEGIQTKVAPVYPVGSTNMYKDFSGDLTAGGNPYFNDVRIKDDVLYVNMTKIYKGYGIEVISQDGVIKRSYKTAATNAPQEFSMSLKTVVNSGTLTFKTLKPDGTYERATSSNLNLVQTGNAGLALYGQAVYNLYSDTAFNQLGAGITQADINTAKNLASGALTSAEKTRLTNLLNAAQALLNESAATDTAARNAVNALYNNNDPKADTVKDTTDQAAIDDARILVDKVTDLTTKTALEADLKRAQDLLDARETAVETDAIKKAVNELFVNDTTSSEAIKESTNQAKIDALQEQIDAIKDTDVKATLQSDLNLAQQLLNDRNEALATDKDNQILGQFLVNQLFQDNKPATDKIKTTTNQDKIDEAQVQIDLIQDATAKAALQKDLDRAQVLLNEKNAAEQAIKDEAATKAVAELFTENNPETGAIKETTDQKAIDEAQKAIDAVTDADKKAGLQTNLDKAKELLANQSATTGTITSNDFTIGTDKYVTGSYTGDVARISLIQDGTEYKGASLKNGEFNFYAVDKKINKTHEIIMVAYDKNGKELSREQVKFIVATEGKITPVEMTIPGDNNITGTYTGDVSKIEVTVTNAAKETKTYKGGTVADGAFKFYSSDKVTKATDVVVVKAYDNVGKLLDTKTVKIKTNAPTTGTITPDTFKLGTSNITGKMTGDVKSLKVTVGTDTYGGGTLNADGTFKFYAQDKVKNSDTVVTISAYDKAGKLLDSQTVTVEPK
ncbi:hypothetical protein PWEIH_02032 [Listeria weihenstephanensis FSL R9-0317]|nr:immunoglobulin-like domain-containing protein [Listeria weihenstephanensis]EUJ41048.1 hypothetical protein PWEIH_02032 [Listeria weihenstephanensis FSL R9-0317]